MNIIEQKLTYWLGGLAFVDQAVDYSRSRDWYKGAYGRWFITSLVHWAILALFWLTFAITLAIRRMKTTDDTRE